MKKLLPIVLMMSLSAFAGRGGSGNERGNGGDGIRVNGKIYLLDLIEHGVEEEIPQTQDFSCPVSAEEFEDALHSSIKGKEVRIILIQKLTELCALRPLLALSLAQTSNLFLINYINLGLFNIKDENTAVHYNPSDLVQLAARQGQKILIDKKLWNSLDTWNKAALILHELAYAHVKANLLEGFNNRRNRESGFWYQDSQHARDLVGALFAGTLRNSDQSISERILNKFNSSNGNIVRFEKNIFGVVEFILSTKAPYPVEDSEASIESYYSYFCYSRKIEDEITLKLVTSRYFPRVQPYSQKTSEGEVTKLEVVVDSVETEKFYGRGKIQSVTFENPQGKSNCTKIMARKLKELYEANF